MDLNQPSSHDTTFGNICCIGAGYVGGLTASIVAYKNPKVGVHVVDLDRGRIDTWQTNQLPFEESGLLNIVQAARDGTDGRKPNLFFSIDIEAAIHTAKIIFIAVNTPTTSTGALETSGVETAINTIARVSIANKIIVIKSTVPPGTVPNLRGILTRLSNSDVHFDILSNPEFLAEGTAVQNLNEPDRVLIGSDQDEQGLRAMQVLKQLYMSWVPRDRIVATSIESAEVAKLAANVLLAQRLSSINALSIICEETGADVEEVALACGMDTRIGTRMLKASLGYGGSCLKKDILATANLSDTLGLHGIGQYWRSINDINNLRMSQFVGTITQRMGNMLDSKKIAVLGFAFKAGTGDVRESPAIDLITVLMGQGVRVGAYDPQAKGADLIDALNNLSSQTTIGLSSSLEVCNSAYAACEQAHAVVIATDWAEFSNRDLVHSPGDFRPMLNEDDEPVNEPGGTLSTEGAEGDPSPVLTQRILPDCHSKNYSTRLDWERVAGSMLEPKLVFDGRNVIDNKKLTALGFKVEAIGKVAVLS